MRSTALYTEAVYPKTIDGQGAMVLHAWSGCPALAQGSTGVGSIQEIDLAGSYTPCSYCKFVPSSMGKVAAASSSIGNGFEHHYNEVAKAAEEYQKARDELGPLNQQAKGLAGSMLDGIGKAFREACSQRILVTAEPLRLFPIRERRRRTFPPRLSLGEWKASGRVQRFLRQLLSGKLLTRERTWLSRSLMAFRTKDPLRLGEQGLPCECGRGF